MSFSFVSQALAEEEMVYIFFELGSFPLQMFEGDTLIQNNPGVPEWTIFHACVKAKTNITQTNIGYYPMIQGSATDFNTIYTMMIHFHDWILKTYEKDMYSKAQMIM